MTRYTCTDCHQPIPAGTAVLRSVSLELRAWCRECAPSPVVRSSRPTLAEPTDDPDVVLAA